MAELCGPRPAQAERWLKELFTPEDTSALEALGARYTETLPVIVTEEVDREGVQE